MQSCGGCAAGTWARPRCACGRRRETATTTLLPTTRPWPRSSTPTNRASTPKTSSASSAASTRLHSAGTPMTTSRPTSRASCAAAAPRAASCFWSAPNRATWPRLGWRGTSRRSSRKRTRPTAAAAGAGGSTSCATMLRSARRGRKRPWRRRYAPKCSSGASRGMLRRRRNTCARLFPRHRAPRRSCASCASSWRRARPTSCACPKAATACATSRFLRLAANCYTRAASIASTASSSTPLSTR
mmetsp:Transcript_5798/g.18431  ORF Transcript_5798/g.18431 Transcript_5798/m.18431 type:complete len:243 (-) Transcript_5798:954-1682(-)